MSRLTGTVAADGAPLADATVVAAPPGEDTALAAARTGGDGGFALDVDAPQVRLLARAGAGDAVGLAYASVDLPAAEPVALELQAHAPLHPITFVVEGTAPPPELDLQLTPARIDGLDDAAMALLHVPVDGATQPMLVRRPLGEGLELRMQGGSWILYAAYDSAPDALGVNSKHVMWRIGKASVEGGGELEPAVIGYRLEVTEPLTVRLEVVRSEK
jgi:hypothetical protein